jgi:FkbM family methyltransferase
MMKNKLMLKPLKKIIPSKLKALLKRIAHSLDSDPWYQKSWSQEGEDQILRRIFEKKISGFYVDIGAHHPMRFSNTYLFYRRGWSGINIDAMPGSMKLFEKYRPRDINIELAIGNQSGELNYYIFEELALNGFSEELSLRRCSQSDPQKIIQIAKVRLQPLSTILDKYMPISQKIDFMSIDVEGLDFEVLKSNNWSKYQPMYVLVEILQSSLHEIENSEIGLFMKKQGYFIYAKCFNTTFFKCSNI